MEISTHAKEVAKGSFWGLLGNILFRFSSFFYTILIAHTISQGDVGLFYLTLSLVSVVTIFSDLGLPGAVTRYLPYFEGKGQRLKVCTLIHTSYKIVILLGFIFSIIVFISADLIGQLYHNTDLPEALRLISAFIIIQNIFRLDVSLLQGKADIKSNQLGLNIQNFAKLILTVILFYFYGFSAQVLIISFVLSYVAAIIIMLPKIRTELVKHPITTTQNLDSEFVKEIIPLGLAMSVICALYTVLTSLDRILMGLLLDPVSAESTLAVYSLATAFALSLNIFPGAVQSIFFPIIAKLFGKGDQKEALSLMQTSQRWAVFITIPIAVVMILFSSDMLVVFYGVAYESGWIVLSIFSISVVLTSISTITSLALVAKRLIKLEFQIIICSALVNVFFCAILIPLLSMEGAALAWLFSMAALVLSTQYYGKKILNFVSPPELYKLLFAGAISFLLAMFLKPVSADIPLMLQSLGAFDSSGLLSRFIYLVYLGVLSIASSILFVIIALFLKCFHHEDISLMKSALRKAMVPAPIINLAVKIASYGVK